MSTAETKQRERVSDLDVLIAGSDDVDKINRELVELQFAILSKQVTYLTLDDLRVRIRTAAARVPVIASLRAIA